MNNTTDFSPLSAHPAQQDTLRRQSEHTDSSGNLLVTQTGLAPSADKPRISQYLQSGISLGIGSCIESINTLVGGDQISGTKIMIEALHLSAAPAQPSDQRPATAMHPQLSDQEAHAVTADLILDRGDDADHTADLRIMLPGSASPISPLLLPVSVAFDQARLRALALDPHAYGRALSTMLFADPALRSALAQARAVAAQQAVPLRLCLTIRPEADELHGLRWECLADPDAPEQPLGAGTEVLLVRTMPSTDWSALPPRAGGPLRALAFVAAPRDLPNYGLSPIDAAQEIAQIRALTTGWALTALDNGARATLSALLGSLHAGCDLLVLQAHGRLDEQDQTWLYLEDEAGNSVPTPGATLVARLAGLANKPRLVILAACESAGDGTGATLAALGPQLLQAGVPAVLAMQGRISRTTLARFLPTCLHALPQDGRIDRAVALARSQTADRPDWWAPALWMRPGDGLLWTPRADPPVPAAPSQTLHHLRAPVADFVGRNAELARLVTALRNVAHNCAALGGCAVIGGVRGMAGLGKTELALAAAAQLRANYPDGQLLLELRGSSDTPLGPVQALQQVIRAFRPEDKLPEELPALEKLYRSVLTGRRALLLADDAQNAAQVRPLLPPAGCALLITSRQHFTLDGMTVLDLSRLDKAAAIRLLRGICPRIARRQARELAALCSYLPLALRVSAGILLNDEALSVEHYLSRLADERQRLSLLRDPDDPTRDVEASLLLSYAALDGRVQGLFRRLGVLAGDADLALIAAVLGLPEDEADGLLRTLLRRSLVEYDVAHKRWGMHDLVRSCALGLLAKAGEEGAVRRCYAEQVIRVIQQADLCYQRGGEGVLAGLALFDRERVHLEAVRAWLSAQPPATDIDALLIAEAHATTKLGLLRDLPLSVRVAQVEKALSAAQRQRDRAAEGRFVGNLGDLYRELGQVRRWMECFEQALAIARELGDRHQEGQALDNLGLALHHLGEVRRAVHCHELRLAIARELGDRNSEGRALDCLGLSYHYLGELRVAIDYQRRRLAITRELGDRLAEGYALGILGYAYWALGDMQAASDCNEQWLTIVQEVSYRHGEGIAIGMQGVIYTDQGDLARAFRHYALALQILRENGERLIEAYLLNHLSRTYLLQGDLTEALAQGSAALSLACDMGYRRLEGIVLHTLATIHAARDQPDEADANFTVSLATLERVEDQAELARARWSYGLFLLRRGERQRGIDLMAACVAYEQRIGHTKAEEHAALVAQLRAGETQQA